MSGFDLLHPALQHHIVNSLGWRELRPFQDEVIPQILDGKHLIVLAPTAGGKTEAAFFPVASRMLEESWTGLSVLYVCPIKALLNNLHVRLDGYCRLIGRKCSLWHGDIGTSERGKILREPPDILLTTPESLEVMLISQKIDRKLFFANLQAIVIDEIHAFAGDDRGWHLLSVLERVSKLAGREVQRIGLSATVGNPETLVDWLAGSCQGLRGVYMPAATQGIGVADVKLDFVGSLTNAATVISRMHRGEKRLVFVDSRAKAETLSRVLRDLEITTFVTHSSLSQEQRLQAEEAFATREDCVIVATSVLELGVDVGNLDRVIQIDSPSTVASFLQRMGRTGRRAGSTRNCLFLATKESSLLQAAGLIDLWQSDYIEPVRPPVLPYHILAQQMMAIALQTGGVGRKEWFNWISGVYGFGAIPESDRETIVEEMISKEILWDESGILWLGRGGEDEFGRRNFMELFSVFTSPPVFTVLHGRFEIGTVDQSTFLGKEDGPRIVLLGGKAWKVNHIDWKKKVAYVEPTQATGRSQWFSLGYTGLGYALSQSIQKILAHDDMRDCWSKRACERLREIRMEHPWVQSKSTALVQGPSGGLEWWNFGGFRANASFTRFFKSQFEGIIRHDSFKISIDPPITFPELHDAIIKMSQIPIDSLVPEVDPRSVEGLKFSVCLPEEFAIRMLEGRLYDAEALELVLRNDITDIVLPPELRQEGGVDDTEVVEEFEQHE